MEPKPPFILLDINPQLFRFCNFSEPLIETYLISCLGLVKIDLSGLRKGREWLNIGFQLVRLFYVFHINFMIVLFNFFQHFWTQIFHVLFLWTRVLVLLKSVFNILLESMFINTNWWPNFLFIVSIYLFPLSLAQKYT